MSFNNDVEMESRRRRDAETRWLCCLKGQKGIEPARFKGSVQVEKVVVARHDATQAVSSLLGTILV